jgi:hypothetical protein
MLYAGRVVFLCRISHDTLPAHLHALSEDRPLGDDHFRLDWRPQSNKLSGKSIRQFCEYLSLTRQVQGQEESEQTGGRRYNRVARSELWRDTYKRYGGQRQAICDKRQLGESYHRAADSRRSVHVAGSWSSGETFRRHMGNCRNVSQSTHILHLKVRNVLGAFNGDNSRLKSHIASSSSHAALCAGAAFYLSRKP